LLLESVQDRSKDPEQLEREHDRFEEFSRTVLRQNFSTDDELGRFGAVGFVGGILRAQGHRITADEKRRELLESLQKEVDYLSDLRDQLSLYQEGRKEVAKPQADKSVLQQHFHGPAAVQVGSHNVQNATFQVVEEVMRQLDEGPGSEEEKKEAKGLLRAFLMHPLVAAIVGASVRGMLSGGS